jgi:hypothetical protein
MKKAKGIDDGFINNHHLPSTRENRLAGTLKGVRNRHSLPSDSVFYKHQKEV